MPWVLAGAFRATVRPAASSADRVRAAIGFYRRDVSPRTPATCRHVPSCSAYADEAVQRFGTRRGLGLAARRLVRCRPGSAGGHDPVPTP